MSNRSRESEIIDLVAVASAITAIIAVIKYFDDKRHKALNVELMALDREIKELQLHKAKQDHLPAV